MNLKRLLVAVIVSFLALFSRVEAKLTQVPTNTEALVGGSVRLKCFTENKVYPPSWSHVKVGSSEPKDVYMTVRSGNEIVGRMTEEYYARFRVDEDRTTGEYSLVITDVQLNDAGRYMCTARGGLGQQATAELGVIEAHPHCASNITEAIGENVCNYEPDHIGLFCSFRYNGNALPSVNWVKTNQPGQVVRIGKAKWTGERGMAVSEFVLRADTGDLDGSSFMCMPVISSSSEANDQSVSCTTPVINVLKIANSTESRTLVQPEEVQCNSLPHLTKTGCKWVKRNTGEDSAEDSVVTDGSLLNLYRPEFDSGIYICIVESKIRGQSCPVEALKITYERGEPTTGGVLESSSTSNLAIILTVVLSVVITIAITVPLVVYCLNRKKAPTVGLPEQGAVEQAEQDRRSRVTSNERRSTPDLLMEPLTGRSSGSGSGSGSSGIGNDESSPLREDEPLAGQSSSGDHVVYDMPDSYLHGRQGDRELRNRLVEEKALARMRKNAALRQGSDNAGFSPSPDDGDVAEGIGQEANKSKDE